MNQATAADHSSGHASAAKGPWRITFDTNPDTCNMRCVMCEEHSPYSTRQTRRRAEARLRRLMPIALIEQVIADAAPHGLREIIPSTMGEPLLYEHFQSILKLCAKYAIQLNLTTNGSFPRIGARAWAERLVPVTSDIKVSWNGACKDTQEAIMPGSNWERVLGNLRQLIAVRDAHAASGGNRCRITLQMTFLESNVAELADIVRLAVGLGVERIKGHHLWAHFDAIEALSMRRSPASIRRWNAAVAQARGAAAERPLANGETILLENIFPLDPDAADDLAPGGPCPFLGLEAWVSATGRFDPCCAPDTDRRGLGDFGSLHQQGMMTIWQGEDYQRLLATYRDQSLCVSCNMRKPMTSA